MTIGWWKVPELSSFCFDCSANSFVVRLDKNHWTILLPSILKLSKCICGISNLPIDCQQLAITYFSCVINDLHSFHMTCVTTTYLIIIWFSTCPPVYPDKTDRIPFSIQTARPYTRNIPCKYCTFLIVKHLAWHAWKSHIFVLIKSFRNQ